MSTIINFWEEYKDELSSASENALSEFCWMVEFVLQSKSFHLVLHGMIHLKLEQEKHLTQLVERRLKGEPLGYILGFWDFYGRSFKVGPGVLIPRPETEMIVDIAHRLFSSEQGLKIVDLGSGTGCLAITLALEFPNSQVVAVEKSKQAEAYLKKNAVQYGLESLTRWNIQLSDVEDWYKKTLCETWDLVVANPPYIQKGDLRLAKLVKDNEPEEALYSEDGGFFHLKSWSKVASQLLKPGGVFLCEIGQGQDRDFASYVTSSGDFDNVEVEKDLTGIPRVLIAVKNGEVKYG